MTNPRGTLRRESKGDAMKKIWVTSKKYDHALRDQATVYLVSADEAAITLFIPPGTPYYYGKRATWLTTTDGLLQIFPAQKWYNVLHICEQKSGLNTMYAHVAMPPTLRDDSLEWIDLDLDYRVHIDGTAVLLDEEDFALNQTRLHYPESVISAAEAACREIKALHTQQRFPFNYQTQVAHYQEIIRDNALK